MIAEPFFSRLCYVNDTLCPAKIMHQTSSQIREQMSGPEISEYEKSILDCGLWPGLDCGIKGS